MSFLEVSDNYGQAASHIFLGAVVTKQRLIIWSWERAHSPCLGKSLMERVSGGTCLRLTKWAWENNAGQAPVTCSGRAPPFLMEGHLHLQVRRKPSHPTPASWIYWSQGANGLSHQQISMISSPQQLLMCGAYNTTDYCNNELQAQEEVQKYGSPNRMRQPAFRWTLVTCRLPQVAG